MLSEISDFFRSCFKDFLQEAPTEIPSLESQKEELAKCFETNTVGLGDQNFVSTDEAKKTKSHSLYRVLPQINLYFDMDKKSSIEFLKNNGIQKLKEEISQVIPLDKFKITDIRIGSVEAEITYLGSETKEYIRNVIEDKPEEDLKKSFKKHVNDLSKKIFKCFNKADLKHSVNIFNLEKTKGQTEKIKKFLESQTTSGLSKRIDNLVEMVVQEASKQENRLLNNVEHLDKAVNNMLSMYNYNKIFVEQLDKAKKDSIFDYVVCSLPIIFKDSSDYEKRKKECKNCQREILFHGTKSQFASKIMIENFNLGSGKLGLGFYFSDMLDYTRCYSLKSSFVPKVGDSFYIVASEVFFDKQLCRRITDNSFKKFLKSNEQMPTEEQIFSEFQDKSAKKNGINYALSAGAFQNVLSDEDLPKYYNKFVGREYLISSNSQMNPIYGIALKRSEYCIIWRDPNFKKKNDFTDYISQLKNFLEEEIGFNLYIETSTEEALKLVNKKKYNKVILVSNIGEDLGGKDFVEKARRILCFDALVLFSSFFASHLDSDWFPEFPNALFSNKREFFEEFFKNYNENGLEELKRKMENHYQKKFRISRDIFSYPLFINGNKKINEIDCTGFELYKHKFLPNPQFN